MTSSLEVAASVDQGIDVRERGKETARARSMRGTVRSRTSGARDHMVTGATGGETFRGGGQRRDDEPKGEGEGKVAPEDRTLTRSMTEWPARVEKGRTMTKLSSAAAAVVREDDAIPAIHGIPTRLACYGGTTGQGEARGSFSSFWGGREWRRDATADELGFRVELVSERGREEEESEADEEGERGTPLSLILSTATRGKQEVERATAVTCQPAWQG